MSRRRVASPLTTAARKAREEKPLKKGKARNYDLGNGIYRFSRTRVYHKKALYKFVGKKVEAPKKQRLALTVTKPIGGEKNGSTRTVLLRKRRCYYPTADPLFSRPAKNTFKKHRHTIRKSFTQGTVCILLAGPHKGKRVVYLNNTSTGFLVVTGPFKLNGCPIRRISQRYVIATKHKIELKGDIPKLDDDFFFRKPRSKRAKKEEGDIFATKKETYKPSEERKNMQKQVDSVVLSSIKASVEKKVIYAYLASMFGLKSSQYPHRMDF